MNISKSSSVTLPTTLGVDCSFKMPSFSSKIDITDDEKSLPIYLDSYGNAYDKNYLLIPSSTISSQNIKNKKHKKQIVPFPNPKYFKSKIEFENACIHWKKDVQDFFSGAVLPKSIISYFYYPSLPSIFTPGTSEHRAFKSKRDPPIPFNSLNLFEILSQDEIVDIDEPFPKQTPNRDIVKYSDQMTYDPQWQTQLIPQEPIPSLYNTFEDYEKAYKKWASIISKSNYKIKTNLISDSSSKSSNKSTFLSIPPAKNIQSFLKIDYVVPEKDILDTDEENAKIEKKRSQASTLLSDQFKWVEQAKKSYLKNKSKGLSNEHKGNCFFNKTKIRNALNSINISMSNSENPLNNDTDDHNRHFSYYFIGFDGERFVDDFKDYGIDTRSIQSDSPIYVNSIVPISPTAETELIGSFIDISVSLKKITSSPDYLSKSKSIFTDERFKKISRILDIEFDGEILKQALLQTSSYKVSRRSLLKKSKTVQLPGSGSTDDDYDESDDDDDENEAIQEEEVKKKKKKKIRKDKIDPNNAKLPVSTTEKINSDKPLPNNATSLPKDRTTTINPRRHKSRMTILEFFKAFFTPKKFIKYLKIFFNEMDYRKFQRMGFLLPYIVTDTFIDSVIKNFLKNSDSDNYRQPISSKSYESIWKFYYFTTHLLVFENHPRRTIFKPETKDEFSLLVTQLYYLDLILTWSKITYCMQQTIRKNCRNIEIKIVKYLKSSKENRFQVLSNETIKNTNIIEMIVEMTSTQPFNCLISLDNQLTIMKFLNDLILTEKGKKLLLRIAFNSGGNGIYDFISMKGLYLDKNSPSAFTADVFSILLYNFYDYMTKLKASYNPAVHFRFFDQTTYINPIIAASRVICNTNIKLNDQLYMIYRDLAKDVALNKSHSFEKRLQSLSYFFDINQSAKVLITTPAFTEMLANSLAIENNTKELLLAWKIVSKALNNDSIVVFLLNDAFIMNTLCNVLPDSKNPTVVYEYVSFLISLWCRTKNPDISDAMVAQFTPCIGRLACMISTAKTKFVEYPVVQNLINKYKLLVLSTTSNPKLSPFINILKKHLGLEFPG